MANPYSGTVAVTNIITPKDRADTYPVVGAEHVKGGLRQVENAAALNAIFDEHKVEGMIVYVVEDNVFKMDFNGYKEQEGYNLIIPKDNALRVARTLTRMANMIWEKYDIIANERMGKEEEI